MGVRELVTHGHNLLFQAPPYSKLILQSPSAYATNLPFPLQLVHFHPPLRFHNPFIFLSHPRHHAHSLPCHNTCDS